MPRRWCHTALAPLAVLVAVTVTLAGCGSGASRPTPTAALPSTATAPTTISTPPSASPAVGVALPDTPAGRQAQWLFAAAVHAPIPTAQLTAHFDAAFLTQVPPDHLNETFVALHSLQVDRVTASTPDTLGVIVTTNGKSQLLVTLSVDPEGLISGLLLQPAGAGLATPPPPPPVPTTWAAVESQLRGAAPSVDFLAAAVDGSTCTPIQAINPTTAAPLASSFKLYVLDALARAIAAGTVSWSQQLTVTSQVKSIPSGILQAEPDGTHVSVQQAATDMIQISDNTATDMLIGLLGRNAVEAAMRDTGMADPARNVPLLTTREMFILKADDWPTLANRYLALGPAARLAFLTGTVDPVPLGTLPSTTWTTPRNIAALEWFASPTDLCRVYASLATLAQQPKLASLASILTIPGATGNPGQWRSVWFKGGSEPGVLTANYLATTQNGKTYVVSILAANPAAPISPTATQALTSAAQGALNLAAGR
ncbi:MAG TPA: serine hydrolase [Thermomicrobiaceae bacterium]|nr:serine hydrolase [Thermomicrobiaceae bacterium]